MAAKTSGNTATVVLPGRRHKSHSAPTVVMKRNPIKKPPPTPNKKNSPGRPKAQFNPAKGFKTAATGETRNSPMTDPNILFWLGVALIIFAGWSSGRIQFIFSNAINPVLAQKNGSSWFTQIKVFASQFLFLFIMVITARAVPPLARIWLVMIGGLWVLYLMKNPQVLQLLNWTSVGASNPTQYQDIIAALAVPPLGATGTNFQMPGATGSSLPTFGATGH